MGAGLCRFIAALAMAGLPVVAVAQVVPPSEQPGRERERFTDPQAPRARPSGPVISLPGTVAPPGAERTRLLIRSVRISGATVYNEADLAPLYQDLLGRPVTLQAVYEIARRITEKYGADGYVLSRAIVPPQSLNNRGAALRIKVVEGYVDRVEWPREKLARYRDFFTDYAAKITADRPANIKTLERYLLLANDLPGLKFATSLRASKTEPAASTLVVEVTEKPVDALARIDNRGTPARGPFQYLGSATVNNIFGAHESFTATWAGVVPFRELQYAFASYRQVLNSEGLTGFVNGSYSWGKPGTAALEALDYKTHSAVFEAGLSYPVIRARERNLTLTGLFFMTDDEGNILDNPSVPPSTRDRLRGFRLKADGDFADRFLGITQVNVTYSQGIEGLGSTENGNPLASRAPGRVDFSKIEGTISRLQPLVANFSLLLAAYGQYAMTPLLVSEQCGYGGRFFGRAFDPSQLIGDHCWQVLGELRYDLPLSFAPFASMHLTLAQLYAFADHGEVHNLHNINNDFGSGLPANLEGSSVGGGVRLGWVNKLTADLSVAKAVEGPRDDWRFFFILAAKY
jgi:hemolysin activation/secretion protein